MRFDYLHARRMPLWQGVRVPERLHAGLCALAGAAALVTGAWSIETVRLQDALAVQETYQARYDRAQQELERADVLYDRARTLVALDRQVRAIAASGDADARELAEIANRLPRTAWLTGISHDATGLVLQGRAADLSAVGEVVRGFLNARYLRSPQLVNAVLDRETDRTDPVAYEIHLEGAHE